MKLLNTRFSGVLLALLMLAAASLPARAQQDAEGSNYAKEHYNKHEYRITMRDGVKLYTIVYTPKDTSKDYPMVMMRTPYSVAPYEKDKFRRVLGPNRFMMEEGYIFVYQDVRGRYMSEGQYDNMRPHIENKTGDQIDESTDSYDTIDWLVKNIPHNSGKVGQWGISYPGFYTAASLADAHPALVAASPQAPVSDFYFDDFHHRGAYTESYWLATAVFGYQKDKPTTERWYPFVDPGTPDGYQFYMDMGPLKNADKWYGEDNFFWQQLVNHPNYDEFWQKRNILPHLKRVNHTAVMTVGGWFDAEDLYGALHVYSSIEEKNPGIHNTLVMGPWGHGEWARNRKTQIVGDIAFGDSLSYYFKKDVEAPFFHYYLKGGADPKLPEAYTFDTGRKEWRSFDQWPPAGLQKRDYYFHDREQLNTEKPSSGESEYSQYESDPAKAVPYIDEIKVVFTPRAYMTGDQRFAARRPDVLVFQSQVLKHDVTLAGDITAHLNVSTSGTASDWVVKLIDHFPGDTKNFEHNPKNIKIGDYQMMVRSEIIRGRYRNSYEHPEPFTPNKVTKVELPLQDVLHTFKKGHRIMVQVQSTWFPLFDRNPQKYVPNIFKADSADFIKATQRVYHSPQYPSSLEVHILPQKQ